MKTILLIASLLIISYAADLENVKLLYKNYQTCLTEANVTTWTPEVVRCVFYKQELADDKAVVIKDKLFTIYGYAISDESKLNQAKEIFTKCDEQAKQEPGTNEEKLMIIITCAMSIKNLLDKSFQ